MVSPYLLQPHRSREQVLRDRERIKMFSAAGAEERRALVREWIEDVISEIEEEGKK